MENNRATVTWGLSFPLFIACKLVGGNYIALWSWWWVLAPTIPLLGGLVHWVMR